MTNVGAASGEENSGGFVLFGITFTSKILGILIGVGGIGLAIYAATSYVVPIWNDVQTGQQNIDVKRTAVTGLEGQLSSKANIGQQIEQANKQNDVIVNELLAKQDNIDVIMRDIQEQIPKTIIIALPPDFSYELAGTMRAFQPAEPVRGAQYDTYSFTIGFDGKFEDVLTTIQKIERLEYFLVVKDLKLTKKALPMTTFKFSRPIAPGKDKEILDSLPPLIGADFTLIAFVPKNKAEREAAAAAAAAAKAPPKK